MWGGGQLQRRLSGRLSGHLRVFLSGRLGGNRSERLSESAVEPLRHSVSTKQRAQGDQAGWGWGAQWHSAATRNSVASTAPFRAPLLRMEINPSSGWQYKCDRVLFWEGGCCSATPLRHLIKLPKFAATRCMRHHVTRRRSQQWCDTKWGRAAKTQPSVFFYSLRHAISPRDAENGHFQAHPLKTAIFPVLHGKSRMSQAGGEPGLAD